MSRDTFQEGSYLATFLLDSRFAGLQDENKQESGVRGQTGRTRGSRKCWRGGRGGGAPCRKGWLPAQQKLRDNLRAWRGPRESRAPSRHKSLRWSHRRTVKAGPRGGHAGSEPSAGGTSLVLRGRVALLRPGCQRPACTGGSAVGFAPAQALCTLSPGHLETQKAFLHHPGQACQLQGAGLMGPSAVAEGPADRTSSLWCPGLHFPVYLLNHRWALRRHQPPLRAQRGLGRDVPPAQACDAAAAQGPKTALLPGAHLREPHCGGTQALMAAPWQVCGGAALARAPHPPATAFLQGEMSSESGRCGPGLGGPPPCPPLLRQPLAP